MHMEQFDFEVPDDASDLFQPADYEIPTEAIRDQDLVEGEPDDVQEPDAITAPETEGEVVGRPPVADAGGGGGDEPPHDWDAALAEFPGDETVLDMPEQEQVETMAAIEGYTRQGHPYYEASIVHRPGPEGDPEVSSETDSGYSREIPRSALEAEGIDYEVRAIIQDERPEEPYTVGIVATRIVPARMQTYGADGNETGSQSVDGMEVKSVAFSEPTRVEDPLLEAQSVLIIPAAGGSAVPIEQAEQGVGGPEVLPAETEEEAPLLRLDEMRSIMRAIQRVVDDPESYPEEEGRAERVWEAVITSQLDGTTISTRSEATEVEDSNREHEIPTVLDMPELERQELISQMADFADTGVFFRSVSTAGGQGRNVVRQGMMQGLSGDALANEGLAYDELRVEVYEAYGPSPRTVGALLKRSVPCSLDIPTGDGGPVHRELHGQEVKTITFTIQDVAPDMPPVELLAVDSSLSVSYVPKAEQELSAQQGREPNPTNVIHETNALLTLEETVALLRVLRRANNV